jgi:hypothetical protein
MRLLLVFLVCLAACTPPIHIDRAATPEVVPFLQVVKTQCEALCRWTLKPPDCWSRCQCEAATYGDPPQCMLVPPSPTPAPL